MASLATLMLRRLGALTLEEVNESNPLPVSVVQWPGSGRAAPPIAAVVVTTAGTRLLPANPLRSSAILTNTTGTDVVWVALNSQHAPPVGSGGWIGASAGTFLTITDKGEVWAICPSTSQTIAVLEEQTA